MIFELHCGDLLPGCPASFTSSSRDRLVDQVREHAGEAHQLTDFTPELRSAVEDRIRTARRSEAERR